MKLTFIGGGNMGEAMLAATLNRVVARAKDIIVVDISEARRRHLREKYAVNVCTEISGAVARSDIVVLAVKPQQLSHTMKALAGTLKPSQLLLSVIAGATIKTLVGGLGHSRIVRVMPNTPAQVGEGVSVWTATPEVSNTQRELAATILGAMGKQFCFEEECYLDMATAVSGSGPAYVFFFTEALIGAARELGFSEEMARELAIRTVAGSARFMELSGSMPAELRRKVTSPGGTTAAALSSLEEGDFAGLVVKAVSTAYQRARELGQQ